MDRDEALKLLRGGEDGVSEWNRQRDEGEEIPSLNGANFRHADLRHAILSSAILTPAKTTRRDGTANSCQEVPAAVRLAR